MFGSKVISRGRKEFPIIDDWKEYLCKSKNIFDSLYRAPTLSAKIDYSVDDFDFIQTLNVGNFSRVVLSRLKSDHKYYVLKMHKKEKIVKRHAVQCILSQKKVMEALTLLAFPFITALKCAFKDNCYLYFCEPFYNGGSLISHLHTFKTFDERISVYFAAQVVLAIEFLHSLGLVFRDIKTENFCLEETGYMKLTHTDFCKRLQGSRTYTICGSPEYIAPEMLLNQGYGKSVDWWSLGILIFELNVGRTPFYSEDKLQMVQMMQVGDFRIPSHCSEQLRSLLRGLIQRDLSRRLGLLKNGVDDIKNHGWFKKINWIALLNQKIILPFRPRVSGPGDTIHVERYHVEPLQTSDMNEFDDYFFDF